VGPQQGRKVFTLHTLPDCRPDNPLVETVGKVAGFMVHILVTNLGESGLPSWCSMAGSKFWITAWWVDLTSR